MYFSLKKTCYINLWAGVEKISHLSNGNEKKWSKTNLFAYLCSDKSPKGVTMRGNNNLYKIIWKNRNKECNEKYICCFFTIWNLISAITFKCGRVALFLASVYFAIRKLMLLFSYSFHVPGLYFLTFIFTFYVPCFPFFLIDHNQKQVLLIKWVILFLKLKNTFLLFLTFWKWSFSQRCFDVDQRYETRRWK